MKTEHHLGETAPRVIDRDAHLAGECHFEAAAKAKAVNHGDGRNPQFFQAIDHGMCAADLELDQTKLNVDGGAISLGHPVGCSGNRIVLHLVNAMKRLGTRRGIATECIGGGLGGAMLIETV
jgi:hypothetical protein